MPVSATVSASAPVAVSVSVPVSVPVSASVPVAVSVPVLVSVSASVLVSMSVTVPWPATDSVSTAGPRPVTWALWGSGQHPSDLDVSTVSEVLVNTSAAR